MLFGIGLVVGYPAGYGSFRTSARIRDKHRRMTGSERRTVMASIVSAPGTGRSREKIAAGRAANEVTTSAKSTRHHPSWPFAACHSPHACSADAPLMVLKEPYPAGYPTPTDPKQHRGGAVSRAARQGDWPTATEGLHVLRACLCQTRVGYVIYGGRRLPIEKYAFLARVRFQRSRAHLFNEALLVSGESCRSRTRTAPEQVPLSDVESTPASLSLRLPRA